MKILEGAKLLCFIPHMWVSPLSTLTSEIENFDEDLWFVGNCHCTL